jgi:hypothetical protein
MLSATTYHAQYRVLADDCCRAGDFGLSLLVSGHRLLAHSFRHLTRASRGIGDDACCKLEKMAVGDDTRHRILTLTTKPAASDVFFIMDRILRRSSL